MKVIIWIIRLLVFAILLLLALQNTGKVALQLLPGYIWSIPLILVGLAFFAVGLIIGVLATLPAMLRLRFALRRARKFLEQTQQHSSIQSPILPV